MITDINQMNKNTYKQIDREIQCENRKQSALKTNIQALNAIK